MRRLLLLALTLVAGCGGESFEGGTPDLSEPQAMMLRLSDLPEGFRYGDDRGCGEMGTTDGRRPELDAFLIETRPRACFGDFAREWGGPPAIVQSAVFVFDSDEDARRAWALRKPLFGSFARIYLTAERGDVGAVAFDSRGLLQLAAGEAWRDGRLVVVVYEEGLSGAAGRRFAAELARDQKRRIASPSDPVEEEEREIGLEDPAIAIPVFWLGRELDPKGLPELELYHGEYLRESGRGNDVEIDYHAGRGGVRLELWRPETWKRFMRTPCGGRSQLRLDSARAELYGGCAGEPDRWLAHVYYADVVVAATASGAYNSRAGMQAVVRGLRRR